MSHHRQLQSSNLARRAAILLLALALAGCGTIRRGGVAPPSGQAPQEDGNWRGRDRIRDVIAALNRGDAASARRGLAAVLRRQPNDGVARQLLEQIDRDPRELLGAENYSYTLREGETLSSVAQRALGNPMLFYALARYNNIAVPSSVGPGQTILIPGHRPAPPPPQARPEPRAAPQRPAPGPAAPAPVQPATNPALAARLRGQGLAAMNAGAIDRAVGLLRRALSLDPANALIRNDLARALRIQSTVRSRH
jgi:tetratricopeptide (TPR) repeat protein